MQPDGSASSDAIVSLDFFCLGFAGPRRLGPDDGDAGPWAKQLSEALEAAALGLRSRLSASRPLCVVGSLAQGADLAIAEAFLAHGAVLRAWLPEPLDRFGNESDFPHASDRSRLESLTKHPQLAEIRVVSSAPSRHERFSECAARVVRDSDAVLCVRHWNPANARGGTTETMALCAAHERPVIEISLDPDPSARASVKFPANWPAHALAQSLPFPLPDSRATVAQWKALASAVAAHSKLRIVRAAAWTVGLQLGATMFSVFTFDRPEWELESLLVRTGVILSVGGIALWSARNAIGKRWARRRFAAELQRSWSAVRDFQGATPWFEEDLPVEFANHGRDLSLLHGLDHSASSPAGLEHFRNRYALERLAGQHSYVADAARSAGKYERILKGTFHVSIGVTLVALFTKLAIILSDHGQSWQAVNSVCALIAILGPTIGAAAVSFVALLDLSARNKNGTRLAEFLERQKRLIAQCGDWPALRQVVSTTERRLLAETKDWYARHSFRK